MAEPLDDVTLLCATAAWLELYGTIAMTVVRADQAGVSL